MNTYTYFLDAIISAVKNSRNFARQSQKNAGKLNNTSLYAYVNVTEPSTVQTVLPRQHLKSGGGVTLFVPILEHWE